MSPSAQSNESQDWDGTTKIGTIKQAFARKLAEIEALTALLHEREADVAYWRSEAERFEGIASDRAEMLRQADVEIDHMTDDIARLEDDLRKCRRGD